MNSELTEAIRELFEEQAGNFYQLDNDVIEYTNVLVDQILKDVMEIAWDLAFNRNGENASITVEDVQKAIKLKMIKRNWFLESHRSLPAPTLGFIQPNLTLKVLLGKQKKIGVEVYVWISVMKVEAIENTLIAK